MALMLVYTKLYYGSNIRIIKGVPYILNRGHINWEDAYGFTSGVGLRIEVLSSESKLILSKNIIINDYVHIGVLGKVSIDENCLIASRVSIVDHDHGDYSDNQNCSSPFDNPNDRKLISKNINIGKNVWIAEGVTILSGTTISDGCIVSANSVAKGFYPKNCIIGGVPARIIKIYNEETNQWIRGNTISRLAKD
ncbi:acetyltransferase [Gammaproteobacteria bacterium]|nr:acetyltransferase [Gammaproteobacteria bacterium]